MRFFVFSRVLILFALFSIRPGLLAQAPRLEGEPLRTFHSDTEPLLDYVHRPDRSFAWRLLSERKLPGGVTQDHLLFFAQTWGGYPWKHHLVILWPKELGPTLTPLIFITITYHHFAHQERVLYSRAARDAKQPLVILYDNPNGPFYHLNEDPLIAYTFKRSLETGDATWPLLFPMTKSVVRAMDVVAAFSKERRKLDARKFVITGASKRGWTTWLSAAADDRVAGIAPIVYNNLNLPAQMKHQKEIWGGYSPMIQPYTRLGLQDLLPTEQGRRLAAMVDPYTFRETLTLPKLIINATRDQFWALDAADFYYNALTGPRNLLYLPNSGHRVKDLNRVERSLTAFWRAVSEGSALPALQASLAHDNSREGRSVLTVHPGGPVQEVRWWVSRSDTADFRKSRWTSTVTAEARESYTLPIEPPTAGAVAVFAEAVYQGPTGRYTLSSSLYVIHAAGGQPRTAR